MSLRPMTSPSVPNETTSVARAAFPYGSLLLSLRDELGPVFEDQRFADLFPRLGQPAEAPWRLALVTLLQFAERSSDRQDDMVCWREAEGLPPASLFISSPHDLDAHYARKGTASWIGYKVHLTETCDDDRPRIVSHVQTSSAPLTDGAATTPAHEALADKELLPGQHLVDTGYIDSGILVDTRQRFGVDLIGPVRRNRRWQAKTGSGFSAEVFHVDWEQQRVTCPRGARARAGRQRSTTAPRR